VDSARVCGSVPREDFARQRGKHQNRPVVLSEVETIAESRNHNDMLPGRRCFEVDTTSLGKCTALCRNNQEPRQTKFVRETRCSRQFVTP
jgi:hypothetical protein